ncbi:MAG: hypothetical protein Q9159_005463 [Coniocarpon cinnabarinum]
MLGIQYPRSLPNPAPPSPPESVDRHTPPSRERLGLRSLLHTRQSPSFRSGTCGRSQRWAGREVEGRAMSGAYGSYQQPPSHPHYTNGTYGSAMAGISSQKPVNNQSSSFPSFQSSSGYQQNASQTSLSTNPDQSRAVSPEFEPQLPYNAEGGVKNINNGIHPYLQLPPTISSVGGSISEFAAQATCLFWFESSSTLTQIEDTSRPLRSRAILSPEALPATGFTKWVTTILSTTQVTQNVILLALLFVHRLKKQNPTVKGKLGSEYRLLTVALMLGNKFLDDNTYTNKTWAEVSGISVTEIHVMEVEFLSHMKYNLYTSKEEWIEWHRKLAHLWRFFTATSPVQPDARPGQQYPFKPNMLHIPRTLPSPPSSNNASSPPYPAVVSPGYPPYSSNAPTLPQPIVSHQISPANSAPPLDYPFARKRSCDEAAQSVEPPPKRLYNQEAYQVTRSSTPVEAISSQVHSQPHLANLPMPTLPFPGQQNRPTSYAQGPTPASNVFAPNQQLPPFGSWQHPPAASQTRDPRSLPTLQVATGNTQSERARQHTPYGPISRHPSPVAPTFPTSAAAHSAPHGQLSPSFFLHQRSSPYRPVRNISTLLVPPPSGQLRNPPQQLSDEQMYWQPLGRQSVTKTGRLPYDYHGAWPEAHQYQHWPSGYQQQAR